MSSCFQAYFTFILCFLVCWSRHSLSVPIISRNISQLGLRTQAYCTGYPPCYFQYGQPSSGCCHSSNHPCCFYYQSGEGSCQTSDYCATHCSSYSNSCQSNSYCDATGYCVFYPTYKPSKSPHPSKSPISWHPTVNPTDTREPSLSMAPSISFAPTIEPPIKFALTPIAIILIAITAASFTFVIIVFAYENKLFELLHVFSAAGDFISDIFFLLYVFYQMKHCHGANAVKYPLNFGIFIVSGFFLLFSILLNGILAYRSRLHLMHSWIIEDGNKFVSYLTSPDRISYFKQTLEFWWDSKPETRNLRGIIFFLFPIHIFGIGLITLGNLFLAGIIFVCSYFLFIFLNLLLFCLALSNSELNYNFYGDVHNEFLMTVGGLLAEDLPQIIIQITYALICFSKFQQQLSTIQILSFIFTIWHLGFSFTVKYLNRDEHGKPTRFGYHSTPRETIESKGESIKTVAGIISLPLELIQL